MTSRFGRHARDEASGPAAELLDFLRYQLDDAAFAKAEQMLRALTDVSASDADVTSNDPGQWPNTTRPDTANDQRLAMDAGPGSREAALATVSVYVPRHSVAHHNTAEEVLRGAMSLLGADSRSLPAAALPAMCKRCVDDT